jgi:hypothetical protein
MLINGQMFLMEGQVTTTDGSQVQNDGTTRMLQEGEAMFIDLLSSRIGDW